MKKNPVGKPPMYKTPAEMQERVDTYFRACEGTYKRNASGAYIFDKHGNPMLTGAVPLTMAGLQNALGFKSHRSFHDYVQKKAFRPIIMKARLRVEQYAEERLFDRNGYSGAAFVLQYGFGWNKDREPEETPTPIINVINDIK